jgi:hypothetical protein
MWSEVGGKSLHATEFRLAWPLEVDRRAEIMYPHSGIEAFAKEIPVLMFLVVLHDVAPRFWQTLAPIIDAVSDLVGQRFASAIVPHWHGDTNPYTGCQLWRRLERCDELLLHGLTHRRTKRPGWISRITNQADEFGGLSLVEIQERVDLARRHLRNAIGVSVTGLVPPAWQLPVNSRELQNVTHVVRWSRIESVQRANDTFPLATWSFDWGRVPVFPGLSHSLGGMMKQLRPAAIPCIAIHPADLSRGQLPFILRRIRALLDAGNEPVTPINLLKALTPNQL